MVRRPVVQHPLPGPKAAALIALSEQHVTTSYTRDYPLVAASGAGCWITDPDGNEFLDLTSGIAVTSTGHCHPEVVEAIKQQADKLLHMSGTDFYYPVQAQLAAKLAEQAPVRGGHPRVYFGNSGTEANEAALKLARWHTRRPYLVSFYNGFHGRTMGALSLTTSKVRQREGFGPLLPGVFHTIYPDPYRMGGDAAATRAAIEHLRGLFATVLPANEVAAIFIEPMQGEGGYITPPDAFLHELRALCDAHGILLVFDEVQTGMGRTGRMWASEHSGVQPDIVTCAKGIASGLPLSAMIASAELMRWPPGAHASTFGGNPIACAAALKTIELLDGGLIQNADAVGAHLRAALTHLVGAHPNVAEVRGRGLWVGVELVKSRETKERAPALRNAVIQACFERGLLLLGCGTNTVRFAPALTLTHDEASVAAEIFADALTATAARHA